MKLSGLASEFYLCHSARAALSSWIRHSKPTARSFPSEKDNTLTTWQQQRLLPSYILQQRKQCPTRTLFRAPLHPQSSPSNNLKMTSRKPRPNTPIAQPAVATPSNASPQLKTGPALMTRATLSTGLSARRSTTSRWSARSVS